MAAAAELLPKGIVMSRLLVVRMVLAFVLCAFVLSHPALAAEPRDAFAPRQAAVAGLEAWYGWLLDALTAVWGENGCRADPYGGCGGAATDSDNGCHLDPYGGCAAAVVDSDNGCYIDPFGGCAEAVVDSDNGCRMDPFGGCGE